MSTDPLTQSYPWYTPYQFAGNKPTVFIDIDGLEEAAPKKSPIQPVLKNTNASESTSLGTEQSKANAHRIELEYERMIEKKKRGDLPAISNKKPDILSQGGLLGTNQYKIAKANWDQNAKLLPGLSDIDDLLGFAKAVEEGNADEALLYALGTVLPVIPAGVLKGPLHHIFTNKNFIRGQQWSKKFEPLFEKAGYKLNDAINKINVPGHKGPHPEEYHEAIYKRLSTATEGLDGDDYKKAFESTLESLKKEVSTKGTELNKLITKEK